MRLAIIGSRSIKQITMEKYVSEDVKEIVSGGAKGIDAIAREFAHTKGIAYTEFLPKYHMYGRAAPLKRNEEIANYADQVLAFWDGSSRGTAHTVELFKKLEKEVTVVIIRQDMDDDCSIYSMK